MRAPNHLSIALFFLLQACSVNDTNVSSSDANDLFDASGIPRPDTSRVRDVRLIDFGPSLIVDTQFDSLDSPVDSVSDISIDTSQEVSIDSGPVSGCNNNAVSTQKFSDLMFGCAGSVTFASRDSLCSSNFSACSAELWVQLRQGQVPTSHYWTNDNLGFEGTSSSNCYVDQIGGPISGCGTTPMRVCTNTNSDPQGNQCNWIGCGYKTTSPNEYFGGCAGNVTAGTLCCASPCADGSIEQSFSSSMFGCAGAVSFSNRRALCGQGYRACTMAEWISKRSGSTPTHNYWLNDAPLKHDAPAVPCKVAPSAPNTCPTTRPIRVCSGPSDPELNTCDFTNCGYGTSTPNQFLGGCINNATAGTLCCPE